METESQPPEKKPNSEHHPLPVREWTFEDAAVGPSAEIKDPPSEGPLRSNAPNKYSQENVNASSHPLRVHIVKDDDLTAFERKTVFFGGIGVFVAFLSLIAACFAAYFVFHQFREMEYANTLSDIAAQRARLDSAESSLSTNKQLIALQAQITAAQKGTRALQGQLKEAQKTTEIASANLELANRAWMQVTDLKPRGNGEEIPAMSYQELKLTERVEPTNQQVFLNFEIDAKNVGNSAAINVHVVPHLYLARWHDGYSKDVLDEETRICKAMEDIQDKRMKGDARPTIANGDPPIFPGEPYINYMGVGGMADQKAVNLFSDMNGYYILPVLIGCMDYQFLSSTKLHHSRFVYEAFHAPSPGSRFFLVGQGVKAKDMQWIRNSADDYAN